MALLRHALAVFDIMLICLSNIASTTGIHVEFKPSRQEVDGLWGQGEPKISDLSSNASVNFACSVTFAAYIVDGVDLHEHSLELVRETTIPTLMVIFRVTWNRCAVSSLAWIVTFNFNGVNSND